jgi:hypothetical protein
VNSFDLQISDSEVDNLPELWHYNAALLSWLLQLFNTVFCCFTQSHDRTGSFFDLLFRKTWNIAKISACRANIEIFRKIIFKLLVKYRYCYRYIKKYLEILLAIMKFPISHSLTNK